jgi:membrane-bound lytic murein transglycosylase F
LARPTPCRSPRGPAAAHRPAARIAPGSLLLACGLLVAGCKPINVPGPRAPESLDVLVRPGPTAWFTAPDGGAAGFDHDLLQRFAEDAGLPLAPTLVTASARETETRIAGGDARVGAGGLMRPAAGSRSTGMESSDTAPVLWTTGFHTVEAVVIYPADGFRPRSLRDLAGARVAYLAGGGFDVALQPLRSANPKIVWDALDVPSADALIALVDAGQVDYAIVASHQAAVARSIYLNFDVAFAAGPKLELAWILAPGQEKLRERIDLFLARARKDGTIAHFADRYFNHPREVQRIDAGVFHERVRSSLPEYRRHFHEAQEETGLEWRLLAALAYQESQWDPFATSETGVRGMMQLTEDTARHLGVADRLDPRQSILAAARYLRDLKSKLPARIPEPDRTWLALAAFNIGLGHLEDARVLAQRQKLDPDRWTDVKKALPLLAEPQYYESARLGYARGGMPVAFVDRVRAYYDLLVGQEKPHQPRLHVNVAEDAVR